MDNSETDRADGDRDYSGQGGGSSSTLENKGDGCREVSLLLESSRHNIAGKIFRFASAVSGTEAGFDKAGNSG